jgi:hypothetical protein
MTTIASGRGDRTSEHAIDVGHCDDDAISDFALQFEDVQLLQFAIERSQPKGGCRNERRATRARIGSRADHNSDRSQQFEHPFSLPRFHRLVLRSTQGSNASF